LLKYWKEGSVNVLKGGEVSKTDPKSGVRAHTHVEETDTKQGARTHLSVAALHKRRVHFLAQMKVRLELFPSQVRVLVVAHVPREVAGSVQGVVSGNFVVLKLISFEAAVEW
jgi:hypothetical protein